MRDFLIWLLSEYRMAEEGNDEPQEFAVREDGDGLAYIVPRPRYDSTLSWMLTRQAL